MKRSIYLIAALMSFGVLQGCDDDDDFEMQNQEFVTQANSSNNLEIMAGDLAVAKGMSASVKAYGQHMKQDHSATGQELSSLAASKSWTVNTSLLSHHQAQHTALSPLTGTAFDKAFAEMMVNSHQEAVTLFRTASRQDGVPDADLRKWAGDKLPALEHHLEEAMTLRTEVSK